MLDYHLMTSDKCVKFQCNSIYMVSEKRPLNRFSKPKKGSNSVKIQSRVMGLVLQGHLMTSDKCVKFQCNSIYGF